MQEFLYPTFEGTYKTSYDAIEKTEHITGKDYVYYYTSLKDKNISKNTKEKIAKSIRSYIELPDEFARHNKIADYIDTVDGNLSKVKSKLENEVFSTFLLTSESNKGRLFKLGEYDFKRKGFPIKTTSALSTFKVSSYFSSQKLKKQNILKNSEFLSKNSRMTVSVKYDLSSKDINFIETPLDKAKLFKENYSKSSSRVIIFGKPSGISSANVFKDNTNVGGDYTTLKVPNIIMEAYKIEFYSEVNKAMVKYAELVKS